uniref:Ankyrin repeat domain 39 n=1 Tax=Rousettus aegyptiacus TaxID=9407 RepID=A0A7J8FE63_ROUAE|nr:ankyrin repeat domain 39 [Rousettus aegyptiacus]
MAPAAPTPARPPARGRRWTRWTSRGGSYSFYSPPLSLARFCCLNISLCHLQHYASRNGHYAVCQFLLENGAKCDAQTHGGATALHRASYCGHTDIARLLLSHGSNPRLVDDDGMTSLHKAAEKGHMDICSLLLQHSPALKAVRDRKARLACDLLPCNSDLRDLLAS